MIRVILYLIVVGLLAYGVALLADRPGDVVITWPWLEQIWPGHGRLETSLIVLAAAIVAAMIVFALLFSLARMIMRSPFMLRVLLHDRRGARAYEAISRGLISVGAGDLVAARKHAAEVNRIAPAEPLALLLSAQAAQLAGDREGADSAFRAMASRTDTKVLGLHGLFVEAWRRADHLSARAFAEEAARASPSLAWAGKAVLEFRCASGDWAGALALLEGNKRTLNKDNYRRQRAVMLTARALAAEESDRDNAKAFALEAAKLAPTLVPAAALAGRMLAESGELRKASRILHKAWQANAHPDLAQVFSDLRFGDTARDRLKRIEALAKKVPGQIEGALALARAAIDAQEYAKARATLAPYLTAPTKRVAVLMAELERAEHNDEGRAREWIARALNAAPDPTWTADGHVSDRWVPTSPSGRLDAFEWRVPLTGIANTAPMIEPDTSAAAPTTGAIAPQGVGVPSPQETSGPSPIPAEPAAATVHRRRSRPGQPTPDAVIPLVRAPDDPGPEAVEDTEPRTEPQAGGGWRKMFE
jgi:HemY protein